MTYLVDCYLNRNGNHCWIFSTRGLCSVAQDELVFIFDENINNANEIISDLLIHIHQIYIDATKGKQKNSNLENINISFKVHLFVIWVYHFHQIHHRFLVHQMQPDFFIYQIQKHHVIYFLKHHIFLVFLFIEQNYLQLDVFQ